MGFLAWIRVVFSRVGWGLTCDRYVIDRLVRFLHSSVTLLKYFTRNRIEGTCGQYANYTSVVDERFFMRTQVNGVTILYMHISILLRGEHDTVLGVL